MGAGEERALMGGKETVVPRRLEGSSLVVKCHGNLASAQIDEELLNLGSPFHAPVECSVVRLILFILNEVSQCNMLRQPCALHAHFFHECGEHYCRHALAAHGYVFDENRSRLLGGHPYSAFHNNTSEKVVWDEGIHLQKTLARP